MTAEQERAKHKNENQTVDGAAILQKNKPFRNTATTQQTKREKGSVLTRNRTNRTKQDKKNCNVSRETQTFLLKKLTTRAERVLRDIKNLLQITRCSRKTPEPQGAPSTVWREVPCNDAANSEMCGARINRRTTAAVMKKRKKKRPNRCSAERCVGLDE